MRSGEVLSLLGHSAPRHRDEPLEPREVLVVVRLGVCEQDALVNQELDGGKLLVRNSQREQDLVGLVVDVHETLSVGMCVILIRGEFQ